MIRFKSKLIKWLGPVLILLLLFNLKVFAAPRVWSVNTESTGYVIASGTAQLLTAPFNPDSFISCNDAATGGQAIYINFSGVTAAAMTVALSTTIKIKPQECYTFTSRTTSVSNAFTVAIMTNAATADYRLIGAQE